MKKVRITLAATFLAIAAVATVNAGDTIEEYVFDRSNIYLNNTGDLYAACPSIPAEVLCATVYAPSQVEFVNGTYRPKSPIPTVSGYPKTFYESEDDAGSNE